MMKNVFCINLLSYSYQNKKRSNKLGKEKKKEGDKKYQKRQNPKIQGNKKIKKEEENEKPI